MPRAGGKLSAAVRRATRDDARALAELAAEALEDPWPEPSLAEEIARPYGEVLVLEAAGQIAGFALAWYVADEASLLLIAVRTGFRRRGFGRLLLEAIESSARARGAIVVHLEVRAGNREARAFYRSRGYEETGVRKGYYSGSTEDAVLMRRSLT